MFVAVVPFHADIVPSSVQKMKLAAFPLARRKAVVVLLSWPDTGPIVSPVAVPGGMATFNPTIVKVALALVE